MVTRPSFLKKALQFAGLFFLVSSASAEPIPVELRQTDSGWQLLRGGEPYFVKGAGGTHSLQQLADAGANSIRTWDAEGIDALLDEAHSLGLSVAVGIWLGHERHGFDYSDKTQVAEQMERSRQLVVRYKDHPAVLLWGIGNEMEGFEAGDNPLIWKAVNDIAAMVKELDPEHPTMSVTAEIGGGRLESLERYGSAIDIHGINSYGGAPSLAERLRDGGATKPYILTEFGPPGTWETAGTEWGAPYEMTSTAKAEYYGKSYESVADNTGRMALGSYAFTWGFKMEATATWYGMFLSDGARLGAVDVMTGLWSGELPEDLAPSVEPLIVDGPSVVDPGAVVPVKASIRDPDGDAIRTKWVLRPESGEYITGGDFRPDLPDIEGSVLEGNTHGARLQMPAEPGPYRLFLYAYDDSGNAATANVPLLVKGQVRTRLPVIVYEDRLEAMPWVPSGWMGSVDSLTLDGDYEDQPHSGAASIRMRYVGKYGWVGVAWQNPPNNWGDQDGGYDLSGATALELWARGEYGGEKISIGVGLIGNDKPYPDSGMKKVDSIVLTRDWQLYRVPLARQDLSSIKTGFVVTLTGRASPVTIYLDRIRFVR